MGGIQEKMCGGFECAQRRVSINRKSGVLMGGGCVGGPPQRSNKVVLYAPDCERKRCHADEVRQGTMDSQGRGVCEREVRGRSGVRTDR